MFYNEVKKQLRLRFLSSYFHKDKYLNILILNFTAVKNFEFTIFIFNLVQSVASKISVS